MADRKKPSKSKQPEAYSKPPPASELSRPDDWLDKVAYLTERFGRFGWDISGTLLIVIALLVILALFGATQGVLITPVVTFLYHWLGWGSWIIAVAAGWGGIWAFRRQKARAVKVRLSQVLALEGSALTLVAWLSAAGGGLLDRAEAGLDGGIIGWGLTEILGIIGLSMPERTILLGVLFVFFAAIGLGLFESVTRWAEKYAGNETEVQSGGLPFPSAVEPRAVPSAPTSGERLSPAEPSVPVPAKRAKPAALPAEFRKSFRLPAEEKDVDIAIPQRSERLPPLNLLIGEQNNRPDERHINLTAGLIEKTLAEFGIPGKVVGFRVGPTVTQFALEPGFLEKPGPDGALVRQKIRVSQISALSRDLALALSVERLRIEAPVPGRSFVGIEVPNTRSSVVRLRPILESDVFYKTGSALAVALGRDVSGRPLVADLSRMPHLLIAGTTGSGKSVCIEALTACMVMNNTPEDLRLVMIDPKMVELVRFNGLPHLYGKVETELERILAVLRWAIAEMDHRYRLLENVHARDIEAYNRKMEKRKQPGLPRIVLIIDELADLMMSSPDQTEHSLVRLAQLARATGIHLVIATQRPSTDVVTGLIKANFPARIAFTVASSVDSRVILDTTGAETLLGRGDMLFLSPEAGSPVRSQGVMITDQEVERIITFWQKMSPQEAAGKAAPWEEMMSQEENSPDALIQQAIEIVRGTQRASASLLQRRLRVGYPRAARLIDELEDLGVIGPSQGGGKEREVLIDRESEDEIE